ncbi:MAG: hypothetical protein M3245_04475 [Actinomycetota bacterium]|nr:hypothetical protein [Actinomycetota bacterium]
MKRMVRLTPLLVALAMVTAIAPTAGASTVLAPQENVRFVANVPGSTGGHVVADGDRLYVGAYGIGLTVFDIKNPEKPVKIGEYKPVTTTGNGFTPTTSDPGLRADTVPDAAVIDGRHIVTLNGTGRAAGSQRTEFLDMTDPANPALLHTITGGEGESHNGDIADARGLWLPSGGRSGTMLRIYDITPLAQTPPQPPARIAAGNLNTMWTSSPYREALGKPVGVAPTHIHDLEIYLDHRVLLLPDEWVDQSGDGTADPTYATKDLAFYAASQDYPLTVGASSTNPSSAVYIVDISDPTAPVVMNKIGARPGHRYLHEVQLLDADPSIMFTSDEDLHNGCDAGGVYSWRLSEDLMSAEYLDSWFNGTGTPAAACSAHVFSSGGDKVFMGSYNAGLQVIDFSDPANLRRAGQYIAEGANSWGALYHKGYVYVGDFGARGLDVFEWIGDATTKGMVKTMDPAMRLLGGITDKAAGCDPASPLNGVDGLITPIPEGLRDGTHTIRSVASPGIGTELDIWFYSKDCDYVVGLRSDKGATEQGLIPEGVAFAIAAAYTAAGPQMVYTTLDGAR